MSKVIDISRKKFDNGWRGVRIVYNPDSFIALMEVVSWGEVQRFRIDFGKLISLDECAVDPDELRSFILNDVVPKVGIK